MSRLKKKQGDTIRFEIKPHKDPDRAPWITVYVHRYEADKNGEVAGMGQIDQYGNRQEIVNALGELVLENALNIQKWMRARNITD